MLHWASSNKKTKKLNRRKLRLHFTIRPFGLWVVSLTLLISGWLIIFRMRTTHITTHVWTFRSFLAVSTRSIVCVCECTIREFRERKYGTNTFCCCQNIERKTERTKTYANGEWMNHQPLCCDSICLHLSGLNRSTTLSFVDDDSRIIE